MRLQGAVAVVTGASRGIGRATALALAARGATVVAVARDEAALAELTTTTLGSFFVADVTDRMHAHKVVEHAVAVHGAVDLVVANAGIGYAGDFAAMPPETIGDLLEVNVRAPLLLARAALPAMLERGSGAIVFVSSIAGAVLVPGESVYSMTKAALEAFAEPLREELRGTGVTVSTVLPGAVGTGFFDRRGVPYDRRFPTPIPPERVATAVVRVAETGAARAVEPRWLAGPAHLRRLLPRGYRALARRFD